MSVELTLKERCFCEAFCSNGGNATRAYRQGGYSASTDEIAGSEAHKLLKRPKVIDYIRYLQACVTKRFAIDADTLIQELAAIAYVDPKDVFDDQGEMLPLSQIPDHALKGIQELTVETTTDRKGNTTIRRKGKLADRQKALEGLMRVTGLTSDLNSALATIEKYGIHLRQSEDGQWKIEND